MEYFLELRNKRIFIFRHNKLTEYGITSSKQSNHVKKN